MEFLDTIICRSPLFPHNGNAGKELLKEAIYLGSSDLYNELSKQEQGLISDRKENQKLTISHYKYESRAQSRCTPFGLFAGVGIARWGEKNQVLIGDNASCLRKKTRLDMNVVCSLAQEFLKKEEIREQLKFYPNNSLYSIGGAFRYVEYYYIHSRRVNKISKVDRSEYLEALIDAARQGIKIPELIRLLTDEEIDAAEAKDFINELIDSQILVSELDPSVTGTDFFSIMLDLLSTISRGNGHLTELGKAIGILREVQAGLQLLDLQLDGDAGSKKIYDRIYSSLKLILPELTEKNLFQADLFKSYQAATLNKEFKNSFSELAGFLNKINPGTQQANLEEFKKRFVERYEAHEIPLLRALDNETGIGYPHKDVSGINPLVDDLFLHMESENTTKWGKLQACLNQLVVKSIKEKASVVHIAEADFEGIDFSSGQLAWSMNFMFKVVNEHKALLTSSGGSSAVNLLGRFAHGDDKVLNMVKEIVKHENEMAGNDRILAEIVHLPESRTGNILARPVFREYEIPYLAKSTLPEEFQLPLSDLLVSVKNNKIILRSKRLNKEIIPRLGNAHNYVSNSLPVYYFLGELQSQYFEKTGFVFQWGDIREQYDFLPRVEYKNIVLSLATWKLYKKDFEELLNKKSTTAELLNAFFKLKNKLDLPSLFLIADGDNELLIDTNKEIAILTFIDLLKNREVVKIEEYIFDEHTPLIKDTNGNAYQNECIAVFLNKNPAAADVQANVKNTKQDETGGENLKRSFSIGSEWLYYKIYCGVKTADLIVTEKIRPIVQQLLEEKIIDKWFFIRYADPDTHIRLRLHINRMEEYGRVIAMISGVLEPMVEEKTVFKLQTDTYQRETERYGSATISLAETLFYHDSQCIADALNMLDGEQGADFRWQFAIRAVDQFLGDFKFSSDQKLQIMAELSNSFFNEHGGKKELKVQLDNKFRTLRKQLEAVLDYSNDNEKELWPLIETLHTRSIRHQPVIDEILFCHEQDRLEMDFYELISSYIHMMMNRLFMAKNRTNEFVVYDLLARYYKSSVAKAKTKNRELEKI